MEFLPPIFITDDNEDDIFFLRRNIARSGIANPVVTFGDGELLMEFLRELDAKTQAGAAVRPALLFLDLKMPGASGFDVLEWIRDHPRISDRLKIVIHSSSNEAIDVERAMALGAHRYVQKHADLPALGHIWDAFLTPAQKTG